MIEPKLCCRNLEWGFVFGSNQKGRHGKGAALHAAKFHGAMEGIWWGPAGNSFAIPTKDSNLKTLPLTEVARGVINFLNAAYYSSGRTYFVTAVGTGLAGYSDADIAPMFAYAPPNCILPAQWSAWIKTPDMRFHGDIG